MKGRPRDPNAVGHRPPPGQGKAMEVVPVDRRLLSAEPPDDLPPIAKEVWQICIGGMAELGHLRDEDLVLLQAYAEVFTVKAMAWASIREHGAMMEEPITAIDMGSGDLVLVGYRLKPNPAVKQHDAAVNRLRLLSSELALNPRARIQFNLMQIATSSIALSVVEDLEKKLEAIESKEAADAAKAAVRAAKRPAKKTATKQTKETSSKKKRGK